MRSVELKKDETDRATRTEIAHVIEPAGTAAVMTVVNDSRLMNDTLSLNKLEKFIELEERCASTNRNSTRKMSISG